MSFLERLKPSKETEEKVQAGMGKVKSGFMQFMRSVESFASGDVQPSDVGITFVTDRLAAMPFPGDQATFSGVPIDTLSSFLHKKFNGRYMIWNLSDKQYDYARFDDQVIEFSFPGYPSPPLDRLLSICRSIDGWLQADANNVAIVHCQTGRGRTAATIAGYLTWSKQTSTALEAVQLVCSRMQLPLTSLLNPSQQRYVEYFDLLMTGCLPKTEPLHLDRVIVNTVPNFNTTENPGCCPYLQIFKHGKLLFSSLPSESRPKAQFYKPSDHSMLFATDMDLEGDILIRVRHIVNKSKRATMFRIGFHTGYVSEGIARFERSEVDGASKRVFIDGFYVDLILSKSVDHDGEPQQGRLDDAYWSTVLHRDPSPAAPRRPEAKAVVPEQHQDNEIHEEEKMFSVGNQTNRGSAKDELEEDSFAELEHYVSGMHEPAHDDLGDDDDFLDELQRELQDYEE